MSFSKARPTEGYTGRDNGIEYVGVSPSEVSVVPPSRRDYLIEHKCDRLLVVLYTQDDPNSDANYCACGYLLAKAPSLMHGLSTL